MSEVPVLGSIIAHPGIEYILHEHDEMIISIDGRTVIVRYGQDGKISVKAESVSGTNFTWVVPGSV